ncbi:MAG: 23S rRNA (pseudouridine(1915)-N(3))-methyltransferase RlmH [Gemmatimonadota bacterium]
MRLLTVGGMKGPPADLADGYVKRAAHYWTLDVEEVAAGARGADPSGVRTAEAERLLHRIEAREQVVALTRTGEPLSSEDLARLLEEAALRSTPRVTFVIGGAFGLGEALLDRAQQHVSLGGITLPHELARVVMLEQLYRAGTISRGEPYHKGGTRR